MVKAGRGEGRKRTSIFWNQSSCRAASWLPLRTPRLEVMTIFLAPYQPRNSDTARPKPPRPPLMMYTLSGLHRQSQPHCSRQAAKAGRKQV